MINVFEQSKCLSVEASSGLLVAHHISKAMVSKRRGEEQAV